MEPLTPEEEEQERLAARQRFGQIALPEGAASGGWAGPSPGGGAPSTRSPAVEPPADAMPPAMAPPQASPTIQPAREKSPRGTGAGAPADPYGTINQTAHDELWQAQRQKELNTEKAGIVAGQADEELKAQQKYNADRATAIKAGHDEINKRKAQVAEAEDKLGKMDFHSYWSDKSTGNRVLAALSVGLGALGSRGGENRALEIVEGAIERDYRAQRDRIAKQERAVESARKGKGEAEHDLDRSTLELDTWKAGAYATAAAKAKQYLAMKGETQADIEGNRVVIGINAKADEARQKREEDIARLGQTKAQTTLAYASAGHMRAETEKTNAEAAAIAANGGMGGGGRAAAQMQRFAMFGTSIRDNLQKAFDAGPPDPKTLEKLYMNDQAIRKAEESHGLTGAGALYLQGKGVLPISRFNGIPQRAQDAITAYEIVVDKTAEVLGQDKDAKEAFRKNMMWSRDDTPETKLKKMKMTGELAQKAINLSQQYAQVADGGIPGVSPQIPGGPGGAKGAPQSAGGPLAGKQRDITIAQAYQYLQKNPNDQAVRQKLTQLLSGE